MSRLFNRFIAVTNAELCYFLFFSDFSNIEYGEQWHFIQFLLIRHKISINTSFSVWTKIDVASYLYAVIFV